MGFGDLFRNIVDKASDTIQTVSENAEAYINEKKLESADKKQLEQLNSLGVFGLEEDFLWSEDFNGRFKEIRPDNNILEKEKENIVINKVSFKQILESIDDSTICTNLSFSEFNQDLLDVLNKFYYNLDSPTFNEAYAFFDTSDDHNFTNGILFFDRGLLIRIASKESFWLNWEEWIFSICTFIPIESNQEEKNSGINQFTLANGDKFSSLSKDQLNDLKEAIVEKLEIPVDLLKSIRENRVNYLSKCLKEESSLSNISASEISLIEAQINYIKEICEDVGVLTNIYRYEALAFISYINGLESSYDVNQFKEKLQCFLTETESFSIDEIKPLEKLYEEKVRDIGLLLQGEFQAAAEQDDVGKAELLKDEVDSYGMKLYQYAIIYNSTKLLDTLKFDYYNNNLGLDAFAFLPIHRDDEEIIKCLKSYETDLVNMQKSISRTDTTEDILADFGIFTGHMYTDRKIETAKDLLASLLDKTYASSTQLLNLMYEYKDPTDIKNQVSRIDEQISKLRSEIQNIAFTKPGEQKEWKENIENNLIDQFQKDYRSSFTLEKDEFETTQEYLNRKDTVLAEKLEKALQVYIKNKVPDIINKKENELLAEINIPVTTRIEALQKEKTELKGINGLKKALNSSFIVDSLTIGNYNADLECFNSEISYHYGTSNESNVSSVKIKAPRNIAKDFKKDFANISYTVSSPSLLSVTKTVKRMELHNRRVVTIRFNYKNTTCSGTFGCTEKLMNIPITVLKEEETDK